MGLDTVGLIMALEDEFETELPEERVQDVRTVNDLAEAIIAQMTAVGMSVGHCRTQQAFYLTRRLAARQLPDEQRRRLRPDAPLAGLVSPLRWTFLRRELNMRAGSALLPDARRGFLRWPVGLPEGPATLGDVARLLASSPQPVRGARPPLGPRIESSDDLREDVLSRTALVIGQEFSVPLERISPDKDIFADLGLS